MAHKTMNAAIVVFIVIKEYYEAKIRMILTDNNLGSFSPTNLHA